LHQGLLYFYSLTMQLNIRRENARALFQALEKFLKEDEILADKQCVRLLMEKEQAASTAKRFDTERAFRHRFLYDRIDTFLSGWLRRRDIKADPFKVFRYEGSERGPTQHETAIGPSQGYIDRMHDRLAEQAPEINDCRKSVARAATRAIAPAFRLQFPLPFGAVGEVRYGATVKDLHRGVYEVAMYAATGGDTSRGWNYDAGLLILYGTERPRQVLGEALWDVWPDLHERIWNAGRVWVILL